MTTPQQETQVQQKIQEILDECPTGNCIFRGENKKHIKVSSGLYRQYYQPSEKGGKKNPLIEREHFSVVAVEKNIVGKARQHIGPEASNIEVLTELQHYGGKTALLDFTKNIHIALFFACDGRFDEDGRVILLETSRLPERLEIDYKQIDNEAKPTHTLISPTGKSPRVIFQSSVFVHVPEGYLEEGKYKAIKIEKDIKEPLLDYLRNHFNIKTETIYNDIQGFILNQDKHSAAEKEFYWGLTKQEEKKYKEAIEYYDKAIELNSQLAEAYYNLGVVKADLGQHIEAIKDYDKAIRINPQYVEAYNNRGNAKDALGQHEEAIKDFDTAIELNPQLIEAYNNRGVVKADLSQYEEAIADYIKAKKLFIKEGNIEIAKKCEERIAGLKNR